MFSFYNTYCLTMARIFLMTHANNSLLDVYNVKPQGEYESLKETAGTSAPERLLKIRHWRSYRNHLPPKVYNVRVKKQRVVLETISYHLLTVFEHIRYGQNSYFSIRKTNATNANKTICWTYNNCRIFFTVPRTYSILLSQ